MENNEREKNKKFTEEEWEKLCSKLSKNNTDLVKWLYDNHKDVLREYEKTKGKLRVEFLEELKE